MPKFNVIGSSNPILHVQMDKNDTIFCEANAMITMDSHLELEGKLNGGFFKSIGRKIFNNESLFQQKIYAHKKGEILLAPKTVGGIQVLNVGNEQFYIADSCYLANTDKIEMEVVMQKSLGSIAFGDNGGFFISKTNGVGNVAVAGFGELLTMNVTENNPIIVDNGHLVAWSTNLRQETIISTKRSGLMRNIANSVLSSEGILFKFHGTGKVVISTRNKTLFLAQMATLLNQK